MTERIIVFGREPIPGQVKTRLIPALGAMDATRIYRHLLERTLQTAATLRHCSAELWCCPDAESSIECQALATQFGILQRFQRGEDLGERMLHAFETTLQQTDKVVLIGSDCPTYSTRYLQAALDALSDHDAILGPAFDGGYVLIGLSKIDSRVFDNVAWSTAAVLEQTRDRLQSLGWRWIELEMLRDLDTPSDLKHFPELTENLVG